MTTETVKVIIPFYTEQLRDWERATLAHNMEVLSPTLPVVFLKPEGLNIAPYTELYPRAQVMEVSTQWLGTTRGIAGYNEMMMSEAFYALFADTEYIMICHLDAWLFRDEVEEWCRKGYDLVAAPWPTRPRYEHFPLKQWLQWRHRLCAPGKVLRTQMFGKIGNGGLCLRRVSTFREVCKRYAEEIAHFNRQKGALYNEDIFFALVPKELKVPSATEALDFAYDLKPDVCHRLHGGRLPMGCHGFMHKRRICFWQPFIPCIHKSNP